MPVCSATDAVGKPRDVSNRQLLSLTKEYAALQWSAESFAGCCKSARQDLHKCDRVAITAPQQCRGSGSRGFS